MGPQAPLIQVPISSRMIQLLCQAGQNTDTTPIPASLVTEIAVLLARNCCVHLPVRSSLLALDTFGRYIQCVLRNNHHHLADSVSNSTCPLLVVIFTKYLAEFSRVSLTVTNLDSTYRYEADAGRPMAVVGRAQCCANGALLHSCESMAMGTTPVHCSAVG